MMDVVKKSRPPIRIPQEVISYNDNSYDLSLMLSYLDHNLTSLEGAPLAPDGFNYMAYAQARGFLKVCYLLLRILLDDVSGIIKYFYDSNEPKIGLSKSFNKLLMKVDNGQLPEDLIALLQPSKEWFRQMRQRRVNLEHYYESMLISIKHEIDGQIILGHFGTRGRTVQEYEDIRTYFGFVLCGYQKLIDRLLDHFDSKFNCWYGFAPHRDMTIFSDIVDMPLRWAYEYGAYRHKDLHIIE